MNLPADWERAYGDPDLVRGLVQRLAEACRGQPERTFMEVCGTHTMAIFRHGIRSLLPPNVRLISGPGCPVCVTPTTYLDLAIALARKGVVIATFGDLVRVPGSRSSLELERAQGADVRIVYAPMDAVELAAQPAAVRETSVRPTGKKAPGASTRSGVQGPMEPTATSGKKAPGAPARSGVHEPMDPTVASGRNAQASAGPKTVVFLGVGFETTSPAVALSILDAERRGLENFRVLVAHRRVIPALEALLASPALRLDGFLLPGHVSTILGSEAYRFLEDRGVGGVVTGFEPVDILRALLTLETGAREGRPAVTNEYARAVAPEGNRRALEVLDRVFRPVDAEWRGLGLIPRSGLALRPEYARFDAQALLSEAERRSVEEAAWDAEGCRCGEVLTGAVSPPDCAFFGTLCTPETPVGACMVSSEGTCAAWYRYGRTAS